MCMYPCLSHEFMLRMSFYTVRGKLRVLKAHSPAKKLENLESGRKKLKLGLGRINAEIPTRSTQEGRMLLQ